VTADQATELAHPAAAPLRATTARRGPIAGDGLLHPVPLAAIALLALNDQVMKAAWPGVLTGKLSDVAGLVFAPLAIVALAELLAAATHRHRRPSQTWLTIAVAAVGLGYVAVKLLPPAEIAYDWLLGAVQWPFAAIADVASGRALSGIRPVAVVPDATDLVALPALWLAHAIGSARVPREDASLLDRSGAWWYRLATGGLSVVMLAGATVDGWAHTHDPFSLETIITPYHAIVYVSFVLVAFLILAPLLAARLDGRDPVRAIPVGYGWSVVGVVAFGIVGLIDLAWHLVFGLEGTTEALVSPTHLGLGVTSAMIASGPLRAAWLADDRGVARWPDFLPAVLSVVAIVGVAAFALHPVSLFVDAWPRWPYATTGPTWFGPDLGIAGAIVPTLLVLLPLLELLRRWPTLPPGTATLLAGATMAGLTFLHDGQVLVGVPILGGFLLDLVLLALPPRRFGRWWVATLGMGLFWSAYFLLLSRTGAVAWSAHLIGGTVAIAMLLGLALAFLARGEVRSTAGTLPDADDRVQIRP
jgi:hypothetical protein